MEGVCGARGWRGTKEDTNRLINEENEKVNKLEDTK
jgi:hypothetical protein